MDDGTKAHIENLSSDFKYMNEHIEDAAVRALFAVALHYQLYLGW